MTQGLSGSCRDIKSCMDEVVRSLRASGAGGCPDRFTALAVQFMAPVATVFACWLLARARKKGIHRLYFLSRDGQLILQAARVLAPRFGGIECRYLQVSRQALFLPSAKEISEEGMPWLFENTDRHALWSLLPKLELEYKDIAPVFPRAALAGEDFIIQTGEDRAAFWRALNTPPLRGLLLERIAQRREAARRCFEAAGLLDPVKRAVVDIGWRLRCQRALNGILREWGAAEIEGFYLGICAGCGPDGETGTAEALFYEPVSGKASGVPVPAVFRQMILIENLFCTADHPTVHRYGFGLDQQAAPLYNRAVSPATLERYHALSKAFVVFAERCGTFAEKLAETSAAAGLAEDLTRTFFRCPDAEAVCPLLDMDVSFYQNDLRPLPVVRPLTWREALVPVFPSWKVFRPFRTNPHVLWHGGSVAISNRAVQRLYRMAYRFRSLRMRFKWLH